MEAEKTYGELSRIVRWTAYSLGTEQSFNPIVSAIRKLKSKLRQAEEKLAQYEPVLPTIAADEDLDEAVESEEVCNPLADMEDQ